MAILITSTLHAGTGANTTQSAKPWPFRSLVFGDANEMLDGIPAGEGCLRTGDVETDFRPTLVVRRPYNIYSYFYTYDFSFDEQGNLLDKISGNKTAWRGALLPTGNGSIHQVLLQNKNCPAKKIQFRFHNNLRGYYFNSQTLRMCNFTSSTFQRARNFSYPGFNDCLDWPKHLRDKKRKFINTSTEMDEAGTWHLSSYAGYFRFNDPAKPVVGLDQDDLTDVWNCFANCPSGKPGKFDPN